jgi:hypothetical protein
MINIVLSEKTLNSFSLDEQAGTFNIPSSHLDLNSQFTASKSNQNMFVENGINQSDVVVLVRMPRSMYDRFIATSKNGMISLPASYFGRYYKNLADLDANIQPDDNAVKISPSADPILAEKTNVSVSEKKKRLVASPLTSGLMTPLVTPQGPNTWHNKRIFFNRMYADTYDYLIGQITPESWSISGNNNKYYAPQEREYYLNDRKDAIEVVVNYDHYSNWPSTIINLFPTVYDEGSNSSIPLNTWESSGPGLIALSPGTFPHAYGYHVQISNGKYYITFEDMNTLQFYSTYVYNDQDNPSTTFTEFSGSSEFMQITSPITDTFSASTNPVIDEWAHDATLGSWRKPTNVWQYENAQTDENFTNIYWFIGGSNSDEIGTDSSMSSAWA